MTDISSLN